jgi:hypothetical protein
LLRLRDLKPRRSEVVGGYRMTNLYDDITPKPKKTTSRKPKTKKVLHVSQIKAKPKPTYKSKPKQGKSAPTLEPELEAATKRSQGGPAKPTVKKTVVKPVVKKSTARKAKVQNGEYDPLAGPRAPKAKPPRPPRQTQQPPKQKQVDELIKYLEKARKRMNEERLVKSRARAARIAAAAKKK